MRASSPCEASGARSSGKTTRTLPCSPDIWRRNKRYNRVGIGYCDKSLLQLALDPKWQFCTVKASVTVTIFAGVNSDALAITDAHCILDMCMRETTTKETHLYGFSPVWTLVCRRRSRANRKALSQYLHASDFSTVWIFSCSFRYLALGNDFPQ